MAARLNDPLLTLGRVVVWILIATVALITLLFVVCLPLAIFDTQLFLQMLLDRDFVAVPQGSVGLLVSLFTVGLGSLAGALFFLKQLLDIIGSVVDGDPFAPANGDRLSRMGWTVLAIQLLAIPLGLIELRLQQLLRPEESIFTLSFADNGLVLALVLFILARVFRKGTEMREELEGTV